MSDLAHILLGKGEKLVRLNPQFANRHGLITGATGTGKTVTLQVLAEGFSRIGVPVFMADAKGDLSGISQAGKPHPKVEERVKRIGIENFSFDKNSCVFWDLYGEQGHPIRSTISDIGPILLSLLLGLNDKQEAIMAIVFRFADDEGLLLLDLKDLRTTLKFIGDNAKQFRSEYGNISSASVGAIQRRLLALEDAGAENFFGEPQLHLRDLISVDPKGHGNINIFVADKLMKHPGLYAAFLLWLLSELFEDLPEVSDQDKPRFVFFFDEAHLFFDGAPKALIEKVAKVVRTIRSKGVGVFFITQSPLDIPEEILGQLSNRIQHALRAFTPKDKKSVKATAQTMRQNPAFDAEQTITELGVGEALVSTLEEDGISSIVERTIICPPVSQIGPASESERNNIITNSPFAGHYDKTLDRETAHEKLKTRVAKMVIDFNEPESNTTTATKKSTEHQRQSVGEALAKSAARSIGSQVGRQISRGILGGLFGGSRCR